MAKHTSSSQPFDQSSSQPGFVTVSCRTDIGDVRVCISDGDGVEYFPLTVTQKSGKCHVLVGIRDGYTFVGFHCGPRSGKVLTFARESDAKRFCDARNAVGLSRQNEGIA